jgi:hypothetical protein
MGMTARLQDIPVSNSDALKVDQVGYGGHQGSPE